MSYRITLCPKDTKPYTVVLITEDQEPSVVEIFLHKDVSLELIKSSATYFALRSLDAVDKPTEFRSVVFRGHNEEIE